MLTTLEIHDGYKFTMDSSRAKQLKLALGSIVLGKTYTYETVEGNLVEGAFDGYEGLNIRLRLADGAKYLAPIVDMGDGSFCTEYMREVK
jgi:hypothetical protein